MSMSIAIDGVGEREYRGKEVRASKGQAIGRGEWITNKGGRWVGVK